MKIQDDVLAKVSSIRPDLQLKLSEVLSSSPSSYSIDSGSVMLTVRQNQSADIYFCDTQFTHLKNYLAIQGIKSINEIKVKYNEHENEVIIIYHLNNTLNFYKGKIPSESTFVHSQTANIPFNKGQQILSISDIYYAPNIGTHCLITTKAGTICLLQYNQQRKVLSVLDGASSFQRKVGGLVRSIFWPWVQEHAIYCKCKTMMYPFGQEQDLYTLILLDHTLHMKYFNLAAVSPQQNNNSCRELSNWQADLCQIIPRQSQIISSIFVPSKGYQNKHKVTLILMVCGNDSKIDMYEILIDLNTQIQGKAVLTSDIFRQAVAQQNLSRSFNKDTDYIDLAKFDQKIYAVCHYLPENAYAITSKRKHHVLVLQREESHFSITKSINLNIYQELKLVKIQKPTQLLKNNQINIQQAPKLLLVGENTCYHLEDFHQGHLYSQSQQSVHSQKPIRQLSKERSIPPIPVYEDQQNNHRNLQMDGQVFSQNRFNFSTEQSRQYQNPFSSQKIERYISRRNFQQLFKLLNLQKAKFDQNQQEAGLCVETPRRFTDQLVCLILLKLLTPKSGLKHQLDSDLINQIFNQEIYTKFLFNNSEKYEDFLRNLFINKNTQTLFQIFSIFSKIKKHRQLYNICVETIPNYLQRIFGSSNKSQMSQQMAENINYIETITSIKNQVAQNYLNLYETLIMKFVGCESMNTQIQQPFYKGNVIDIANELSEYQQKQLFDKYLLVKNLTKTAKEQCHKMLEQIFGQYSKKLKHRKFLVQMAIRHQNIKLFDLLLNKRMVGKQGIENFLKEYQSTLDTSNTERLIVNFVNTQIHHITKIYQEGHKRKNVGVDDQCLSFLLWIPSSCSNLVYEHLLNSFPKIGLIYGLTIHSRKKIAADLSKRIQVFGLFNDPNLVMETVQPLYSCTQDPVIKLNVDLAKIFFTLKKKFISASSILKNQVNLQSIQIPQKLWQNCQKRIQKYLKGEQVQKIRNIFKIN